MNKALACKHAAMTHVAPCVDALPKLHAQGNVRLLSPITAINRPSTHTHTHPFNGPFSGTTRVSRYQKGTRSSAIAEGPRDAPCQLKSCQLSRNSAETTCATSPEQIEVLKLEGYSGADPGRISRRSLVSEN